MQKKSIPAKLHRINVFIILALSLSMISCSVATKRRGHSDPNKNSDLNIPAEGDLPSRVDIPDDSGEGTEVSDVPQDRVPKIGVILGPGGARAYSYIGVLREFEKAKIPIHSIAGLEWGAMIAALYSVNGKAHEVEWKASKIPDDIVKKGILSSEIEPRSFSDLDSHLKVIFENAKVDDGKIPFSCITDNLKTFKSLMIFRGTYRDTLGFCLGYPPITTSKGGWVSSSLQSKYLMEQMALRGVEYIVLIDSVTEYYPLNGAKVGEPTSILWSNISKSINQNKKYAHQTISIPIRKNILDFKSRKEFIQQGERTGKEAVKKITEKFGL